MNTSHSILARLKSSGYRLTEARTEIVRILLKATAPLAADEILTHLTARHLPVNKTTVYREIEFLMKQGVIEEVHFDDRKKRYELSGQEHHHHLICIQCKTVEDVALSAELAEAERRQEESLTLEKKFRVLSHCMEFFGLCAKCQ